MSDPLDTRADQSKTPIFIYWVECGGCGYETAAHTRVGCPECGERMTPSNIAGAVVDDRGGDAR